MRRVERLTSCNTARTRDRQANRQDVAIPEERRVVKGRVLDAVVIQERVAVSVDHAVGHAHAAQGVRVARLLAVRLIDEDVGHVPVRDRRRVVAHQPAVALRLEVAMPRVHLELFGDVRAHLLHLRDALELADCEAARALQMRVHAGNGQLLLVGCVARRVASVPHQHAHVLHESVEFFRASVVLDEVARAKVRVAVNTVRPRVQRLRHRIRRPAPLVIVGPIARQPWPRLLKQIIAQQSPITRAVDFLLFVELSHRGGRRGRAQRRPRDCSDDAKRGTDGNNDAGDARSSARRCRRRLGLSGEQARRLHASFHNADAHAFGRTSIYCLLLRIRRTHPDWSERGNCCCRQRLFFWL